MILFSILLQSEKKTANYFKKKEKGKIKNNYAPSNLKIMGKKRAKEHGVQTLILGAWGCGVFEWNPETVAELFMEVKGRYIIFAVPGLFEYNYMVFNRVLS